MLQKIQACKGRSRKSALSSFILPNGSEKGIVAEELENGATIIAQESRGLDTAVIFAFPFGSRDNIYFPHLLEHLVFRTCRNRRGRTADQRIEMLGGYFSGYVTRDNLMLEIKVLHTNLGPALDIAKESLLDFPLSEEVLRMEKSIIIGELQDRRTQATYQLDITRDNLVLGKEHPFYVHPETVQGIKSVTVDQLIDAKRRYLGARNLYVGMVGPDIKESVKSLKDMIRSLPPRGRKDEQFEAHAKEQHFRISRKAGFEDQVIFVSFLAPGYGNQERYAMDVLVNLLAGTVPEHQSRARIWTGLREKEGIMYSPLVMGDLYSGMGLLELSLHGILKKNLKTAKQLLLNEFEKITTYPVGNRQLEGARDSLILNSYRDLVQIDEVAERLALLTRSGEDSSFKAYCKGLREIGAADVLSVAKKYVSPEKLFIGTVEPT